MNAFFNIYIYIYRSIYKSANLDHDVVSCLD